MKKIIALVAIMALMPMTVHAEDLESRVQALEERVAALEAQLGIAEEETTEAIEEDETALDINGAKVFFKRIWVTEDTEGNKCIVLYFVFSNDTDESLSYTTTYIVKAFQNGTQLDASVGPDGMGGLMFDNAYKEIRKGADPIHVVECFKITDMSDVIVNIKGYIDGEEGSTEFTLSLE